MSHQTSEETQRKAIIRAWNALEASADDLVKKNGGKYIIIYQGSPKDEFEILSNSGNFRNAFNSGAVQTAFTKAQMTTTLDTMKANEQKEAATWVMARARGHARLPALLLHQIERDRDKDRRGEGPRLY